jgi:uncharacterized Zn-finger protein
MTTTKLLLVPIVICNKAFLTNSELKQHQDREAGNHKLHEEAKTEHRCDVCDEKFSQVRYLREHMQLHSNDRIECTKCDINIFDNNSVIVFIYDRFIILQVFIVYY